MSLGFGERKRERRRCYLLPPSLQTQPSPRRKKKKKRKKVSPAEGGKGANPNPKLVSLGEEDGVEGGVTTSLPPFFISSFFKIVSFD